MTTTELNPEINRTSGQVKTRCMSCQKCLERSSEKPLSVNFTEGRYKCHKTSCPMGYYDGGILSDMKDLPSKLAKKEKFILPKYQVKQGLSDKVLQYFRSRGIHHDTLKKMKIGDGITSMPKEGGWKNVNTIQFPYIRDGKVINVKYRDAQKTMKFESKAELLFYNIDSIKDNSIVILCEGEIDALSFMEAGYETVISVPNGANDGYYFDELITKYFDQLNKVYVAVDDDKAGREFEEKVISRIGREKCWLVEFPVGCKDANETLVEHGKEKLRECLNNAKQPRIQDVHFANDYRDEIINQFKFGQKRGETTHFPSIDPHFTWKKGYLIVMAGPANIGKSALILQLMLVKSVKDGTKWAVFGPESFPPSDFFIDLMISYIGKPFDNKFPEWQMSEEERDKALEFIHEHFTYVFSDTKAPTPDYINSRFEELIKERGVDGCLIDPYNQLDGYFKSGKYDVELSDFLSKEKMFALKHNVYKIIVAHTNKLEKDKDGEYRTPDVFNIAGGAMWNNKSDVVMVFWRPNYYTDTNDTTAELHIKKVKNQRLVGVPGMIELTYDIKSGRFMDNGFSPLSNTKPIPKEEAENNWYSGSALKTVQTQFDDESFSRQPEIEEDDPYGAPF